MALWTGKKYEFQDSENIDEFMRAIGASVVVRKIGNRVPSIVELIKKRYYSHLGHGIGVDYYYILKTTNGPNTTQLQFKLGEQIKPIGLDRYRTKAVINLIDNNKLIENVESYDHKEYQIIHEFNEDYLITTMKCDDVVAVRRYNAQYFGC